MLTRYKVNFIIPYYGTFPNYFQIFLNSCKENPEFDWTIVSDCKLQFEYPSNVHLVYGTFEEVQGRIRKLFGEQCAIDSVHKLCEYKPAYAYIFPELVEGYDFWGYCDIDLVFGKISHFIDDLLLSKYVKLFTLGHFSIIKNNSLFNEMFLKPIHNKEPIYKAAFYDMSNYNFDEDFQNKENINSIFKTYNHEVYDEKTCIADIYTKSSDFRLDVFGAIPERKKNSIFVWNRGELLRFYKNKNKVEKKEYMYIHLQKRKMTVDVNLNLNLPFKIIPNRFEQLEVDLDNIQNQFSTVRKKYFNLQYFRIRLSNLKTKLIVNRRRAKFENCNN